MVGQPVRVRRALLVLLPLLAAAFVAHALGLLVPPSTTSLTLTPAATEALAEDGMTPLGGTPAPRFTLVDQNGRPFSLASLHGDAVWLTFLDPVCWLQCPLEALDLRLMVQELPAPLRTRVALVAVDANPVVRSPAALRAFDREMGLTHLAGWHFLTSPHPAALARVWRAYGVEVSVPENGMVDHTLVSFLIDPQLRLAYASSPSASVGSLAGTAQLWAAYTEELLGAAPSPAAPGRLALPRFMRAVPFTAPRIRMITRTAGWRLVWRGGFELLQRTVDGGASWKTVSPRGVAKHGGMVAAFGPNGQAWVVVEPFGYTHTPVAFSTDDWGRSWRLAGILPPGAVPPSDLVAWHGSAYLLHAGMLWRALALRPWRPVLHVAAADGSFAVVGGRLVLMGHGHRFLEVLEAPLHRTRNN
jgi:cytochrome oxidase Cu insertion factor (SCO1/SenC/PrrC family)